MEKKLQRNQQDKMIAGVCSGLADYFDIDVTWVRIAFVITVIAGGSGILAYLILWIAVPKRPYIPDFARYDANPIYDSNSSQSFASPKKKDNSNFRLIAGSILIFFGLIFLLDEFNLIPDWMDFENLWPVILIAMGVYILSAGVNKNKIDSLEPEATNSENLEDVSSEVETDNSEPINSNTDDSTEKPL